MAETIGRNAPCPCGSGQKYKQCCGSLIPDGTAGQPIKAGNSVTDLSALKRQAAALQAKGQLVAAAGLYREILGLAPDDFDALHLLGILAAQQGHSSKALRLILAAARQDDGSYAPVYDNLGRCIVDAAGMQGGYEACVYPTLVGADRPQRYFAEELPELSNEPPRVSIVVPCYNHERYVEEALRSVYTQGYPNIELIVIDDGSRDATVEKVEKVLTASPFPIHFIARENRGAHATINEGIGLAQGEYVGILNSDDRYTSNRVEALVKILGASGKAWGFGGIHFIGEDGDSILYGQRPFVDKLFRGLDKLGADRPLTVGYSRFNYAVSTGHLFFTKRLWERLGGFRDYRYVHDWDFCLRALVIESPAVLYEPIYEYRIHGANTIGESLDRSLPETHRMLVAWGHELRQAALPGSERAGLLRCAWEMAMLKTHQGHEIGRERLLEIGQTVLDSIVGPAKHPEAVDTGRILIRDSG
jgi:glycosyltransferase involved in cell wall biosynthesis